jgi:hypothetical protein
MPPDMNGEGGEDISRQVLTALSFDRIRAHIRTLEKTSRPVAAFFERRTEGIPRCKQLLT